MLGRMKVNDQLVINCNDRARHSCLMLIIVWHEYSMLKLIFDKDVNFFLEKNNLTLNCAN